MPTTECPVRRFKAGVLGRLDLHATWGARTVSALRVMVAVENQSSVVLDASYAHGMDVWEVRR
jgi:hypothetical protein